jgi:hypothetical protein
MNGDMSDGCRIDDSFIKKWEPQYDGIEDDEREDKTRIRSVMAECNL